MSNTRKISRRSNQTIRNSVFKKIKMTNRLLGLHAYRSESIKNKYERIASYVLKHDVNQTLKMSQIEASQSLQSIGKSIVDIVSTVYNMEDNYINHEQYGGGTGLYITRERCIKNIDTRYITK